MIDGIVFNVSVCVLVCLYTNKYAKNLNSYIFRSAYQIDMKFDRQLRPARDFVGGLVGLVWW